MANDDLKTTPAKKKWPGLILKLLITVVCKWYVYKKIYLIHFSGTLASANWWLLFVATVLYMLSKIVASIRLNIYFRNIGIRISQLQNLKLYWLGLFYNLFLPGSITGDAYKVIRLTKLYGVPYKKTTSAVLLDRVTGLLGLSFVLALYGTLVLKNPFFIAIIIAGAFTATAASYLTIKKWFPYFLPGFWQTFFWGLVVQLFSNASAYAIMYSLGISQDLNKYLFIFLIASIAAVLPLTLGGLGAREIVFLELSKYFQLNEHTSVLIGFLVYVTVVISSAGGLMYIFTDPLKTKQINELQPV
jgi:uncharacterized membrane protein YbhN (UPF0104 family)